MSTWCRFLTLLAAAFRLSPPSCSSPGANAACTVTWNGVAVSGKLDSGVCTTTVRYGSAKRWEDSIAVTNQSGISATEEPPSCPQVRVTSLQGASQSEDCLTATIFSPVGGRRLPVLVWLHGGSYSIGSASGLNGAALAKKGRIVVVVLQYRLNVLGLIPPADAPTASDPNLQVRDVILGLKEVRKNLAWQGDMGKLTLGGQSSGAGLIRALWAAPSAQGLFQRMIMQSDPFNYGMAPVSEAATFASALYGASTLQDLQAMPFSEIMGRADALYKTAPKTVAMAPPSQPFRPSFGTPTIPNEPTAQLFSNAGGLAVSPASVPLLLTTTADEGANLAISQTVPFNVLPLFLQQLLGPAGTATIMTSGVYNTTGEGDVRPTFAALLTDGGWRCTTREVARKWAGAGGRVYVGEFREGVKHPFNDQYPLCSGTTRVCHMDDVIPTFGGGGAFADMITDNWIAFVKNGAPGSGWSPFAASNGIDGAGVHALGGDGFVPSCPADFWGGAVQLHWQMYV